MERELDLVQHGDALLAGDLGGMERATTRIQNTTGTRVEDDDMVVSHMILIRGQLLHPDLKHATCVMRHCREPRLQEMAGDGDRCNQTRLTRCRP